MAPAALHLPLCSRAGLAYLPPRTHQHQLLLLPAPPLLAPTCLMPSAGCQSVGLQAGRQAGTQEGRTVYVSGTLHLQAAAVVACPTQRIRQASSMCLEDAQTHSKQVAVEEPAYWACCYTSNGPVAAKAQVAAPPSAATYPAGWALQHVRVVLDQHHQQQSPRLLLLPVGCCCCRHRCCHPPRCCHCCCCCCLCRWCWWWLHCCWQSDVRCWCWQSARLLECLSDKVTTTGAAAAAAAAAASTGQPTDCIGEQANSNMQAALRSNETKLSSGQAEAYLTQ
jgi:hypothetical protein